MESWDRFVTTLHLWTGDILSTERSSGGDSQALAQSELGEGEFLFSSHSQQSFQPREQSMENWEGQ